MKVKRSARANVVTDGPFGESKEAIGGYWFILAQSLDEAVQIAKSNPCLDAAFCSKSGPLIRNLEPPKIPAGVTTANRQKSRKSR